MNTFNYTTTSRTILADLYTPVGVYMRLRDIYPQSALMESSDYHDKDNARSFIGINPMSIADSMATLHSMPCVISRILRSKTRHRLRTTLPTCFTYYIR